jgi:organic radical activating enzyme
MFLYQSVIRELAVYPLDYFVGCFRVESLILEITKKCTNQCSHCSNYGSPQATEFLSLDLLKNIVDQAIDFKHKRIAFWGGEPFLHKDFSALLAYCLQRGLNVGIVTNGFWAESEYSVRDFVNCFQPLLRGGQYIKLEISCDGFHQTQEATPLRNIINIISVLEKEHPLGFDYAVQSVAITRDDTFKKLLACLRKRKVDVNNVKQKRRIVPLEYSVGRAKTLPDKKVLPYIKAAAKITESSPNVSLYITASGAAVFCENFVGEKILPLGSIRGCTLTDIENNLNQKRLLKLLHFQPLKFFFYPFRKYLNIQDFCAELSAGKIKNMFYVRDKAAEILQIKQKQFDKSGELTKARQIYTGRFKASRVCASLKTIELYGDLSDVFNLKKLQKHIANPRLQKYIQHLLNTLYSL